MSRIPDAVTAGVSSSAAVEKPNFSSMSIRVGDQERQLFYRLKTSDEAVINDVIVNGEYDLRRLRRLPELLVYARQKHEASSKRPMVVDVGANIGTASLYFLGNLPDISVLAVEPDAGNFELLERNVDGLDVHALKSVVSCSPGWAEIVDPGEGHWGYRTRSISGSGTASAVSCITMNDIYRQAEPACFPFIAKIDIEGGEADLFSANTEWVQQTPLIIIELHDWLLPGTKSSGAFLRCISQLDRDFINVGANIYSISNHLASAHA